MGAMGSKQRWKVTKWTKFAKQKCYHRCLDLWQITYRKQNFDARAKNFEKMKEWGHRSEVDLTGSHTIELLLLLLLLRVCDPIPISDKNKPVFCFWHLLSVSDPSWIYINPIVLLSHTHSLGIGIAIPGSRIPGSRTFLPIPKSRD